MEMSEWAMSRETQEVYKSLVKAGGWRGEEEEPGTEAS